MAEKDKTPDEASETVPADADVEQLQAIIEVQNVRIKQLAGYEQEVYALRDSVTYLTEERAALTTERDRAVKEAASAGKG